MLKDLKELPKVSESISFIYIEFARIEQDNFSIKAVRENEEVPIPVTVFSTLFLGPGTSITHQAIKICAEVGCLIVWLGRNCTPFYAQGFGETKSSRNFLRQVECYSDDEKRVEVAKRLYSLRFPNINLENKSIQQMMGMEGSRVSTIYSTYSRIFGVKWLGRKYKKGTYTKSDNINQAITYSNSLLYGVCQSIIVSMGYNVTLGFIHTGNILSFVYDLADVYKMKTTVLAAFKYMAKNKEKEEVDLNLLRTEVYNTFTDVDLMKQIPKDLGYLFGWTEESKNESGSLWNGLSEVNFGVNYGDNL